jgi:hypothetical protein
MGHRGPESDGFCFGPPVNFAEIEVPASVLASIFSVTTSLEEMPSPPEKGRQARMSVEQKKVQIVRYVGILVLESDNCPI